MPATDGTSTLPVQKRPINPLAALPSVLAIRDIRRRVRHGLAMTQQSGTVHQRLLAVDPLTALRCMQAAAAPVYGFRCESWTIERIVSTIGTAVTSRALEIPPVDVTGTGPIRRLWLHSVATAHAARILAVTTGILDPEEAYLLGLVHDLPLWLHFLGRRQGGDPTTGTTVDWWRHWNLPRPMGEVIDKVALGKEISVLRRPQDPASLVCAAELLAELADFWHPGAGDAMARELLLASVTREELVAAQRLRREVQNELQTLGLDVSLPEPDVELERFDREEHLSLFTGKRHGNLSEVVLSILGCSKAASYRAIITATTSAVLRYMGYDRAWYVKWVKGRGVLAIRAKADLSSRRLTTAMVEPSPRETEAFARSLEKEKAVRLEAERCGTSGVMYWLGSDESLVVPVNADFSTPSFLIMDRVLSTRPVNLQADTEMAHTLAATASLLNENLLLKRRRQRAQKFALTDPLTRLHNRGMGIKSLGQEVARAQRHGSALTLLMLDLDDFKKLNDKFGHLQGDLALRASAEVLRKTCRKSDIICRYGGEEFMVVLPETTPEDASILAARVFTAVEAEGQNLGLPITVSIGLATMRTTDDVESLLQRADQALYASKAAGRNRFSADVDTD